MTSRTAGGVTESFFYDEGAGGVGRLTRIADATGQTSWAYNDAGELVSQASTIYDVTYTTTWSYDGASGSAGPRGQVFGLNPCDRPRSSSPVRQG